MEYEGGTVDADHLCVLVHGLWGNPVHMKNIARDLRARYPEEKLHIHLAKRNTGSFTYDGIERGGERVCAEIEEELSAIKERGGKFTKLSIVGYSLGGLVSRYAIGLLYAKGILDTVQCMNFATFVTPHLGVRSPRKGWHNHVWNIFGARTLSISGRQLFTIDAFRDTNKPLLAVLADPKSIFISGLKKFRRLTLYTNIVNDRSAVYYTTAITKTDPYVDLSSVRVNYLKGYEDVLLDPAQPVVPCPKKKPRRSLSSTASSAVQGIKRLPYALLLSILVPLGVVFYLVASVYHTIRSSKRIRLHELGLGGVQIDQYRVPLWIKGMREEMENAYETLNSSQGQEFLNIDDDETDLDVTASRVMARERRLSMPSQPTLALAPCQFSMIESLNDLGWRKYPVWIHKNGHAHAAVIERIDKESFSEGRVVLGHFANSEFLI